MKQNTDTPPSSPLPPTPAPYYGAPYEMSPPRGEGIAGLLSPRRLVHLIFRKWWLIVLAAAFGLSAAWFYLSRITPLYTAQAFIEMSVRRPRITAQRGAVTDDTDFFSVRTEELFNTRIKKFSGPRMRELVARQLQSETNAPPLSREQIVAACRDVRFAMVRTSYLVSISCVSSNPLLASRVANAYAESSVQLTMEENRFTSDNAVAWLEQQASQQQNSLDQINEAITAFREVKRIDASENERAALQASMASIGAQLTQLDSERILADKLLAAISQVKLEPQNAGALPDTVPGRDEILQSVAQWLSAIQERDALLARFTPQHPEVLARNQSIIALGEQVTGAIARARSTAEANLLLLEQQAAGLRERMETQSHLAAALESTIIRVQAELGTLERERNVAEMSYRSLLTRIEEARISADENTATVKVFARAVPPSRPFTPRRLRTLLMGLLLGCAGGAGLALLVEALEDRFVGTEDLELALGLPVLGLVPRLRGKNRSQIGRVADADRFGHGAEAYAGIRAKIMSGASDAHPACLLVTSAGPSEGKTITATNLAIAFARTGVKTLLVDFDMRRPKVKSVFGFSEEGPCLLDILGKGKAEDFSRLPVSTDCSNLFLIGNHASREYSAAEIMGSHIVTEFVAWARASYDMVIMDSPPFGVVSDALVLAGLADGVLFVSRPGVTRRHTLRGVVEEFGEAGAPLLGIVVNGVNFNRLSFLSNYDYRYGRGYQTYQYPTREEKR